MQGKQGASVAKVPGSRPGRVVMFVLTPMKRTPRDRKTRLRIMVRAVQYRRGGMHLLALRWHETRPQSDDQATQHASPETVPSWAALAPSGMPADDLTPTVADVRAHVILTAAPPASRAPVRAGAAAT